MKYVTLSTVLLLFFMIEFFLFSKKKNELLVQLLRYIIINAILVLILLLCYKRINDLIVVSIYIILKLIIDRYIVFKSISFKVTNWEKYYAKKPLKIVEKKRKINIVYIINVLKEYNFKGGNIIEFGGGNSKVAEAISNNFNIKKFSIVDSNKYGINLLDNRDITNLNKNCISIFDYKDKQNYDLSYSIGLIEHFQNKDLIKCIDSHFSFVKNNGYVLFTYPMPTLRYKLIRLIYETFNMWQYTDEVPLKKEYVENIVSKKGIILSSSVNKKLILPQGIILIRVKNEK